MAAAITARRPIQSDPLRAGIVVVLWLLLGLFVLYPLACLLGRAFSDDGGFTLGPILSAVGNPTHLRALRNSLLLATLVGVLGLSVCLHG
jgi:iron(III) transport system permease protein